MKHVFEGYIDSDDMEDIGEWGEDSSTHTTYKIIVIGQEKSDFPLDDVPKRVTVTVEVHDE